jgi:hypothetical protein
MDDYLAVRVQTVDILKKFENQLWGSLAQATKDQDTKMIGKINSVIERKKVLESELLSLFDQMNLNEKPVQISTPKRTPRSIPKLVRVSGHNQQIKFFNEIPVIVAEWIIGQGKDLPQIPNFVHDNSRGFARSAQTKQLKNGWFIEVGDSKETLITKGRKLLDQTGFKSVELSVEMQDGEVLKG